jgi:hypothetical protein
MLFTVMPFGPSSLESVFAHPTTAGRRAFESSRPSVGSFTDAEHREGASGEPKGRHEGQLVRGLPLLVAERLESSPGRPARVVHDDVEPVEALLRGANGLLESRGIRRVARDGNGLSAVCLLDLGHRLFEHVRPACEEDDVAALRGELTGDRTPHSR